MDCGINGYKQLPDNEEDQYEISKQQQQPAEEEEGVDFNNYKGIYAEEDAG